MTDDLERRLREAAKDRAQMERETPGAYPRPPRQHIEWQAADEIARLRAENEALWEALKPFAHAAFEADGYPDCEAFTLVLRPDDEDGLREQDDEPESLITAGQLRRARQALQEGSRHE